MRLCQIPDVLRGYDSIIWGQLELGIVQQVTDLDVGVFGQVHYLPHHAVVKQARETTKVRVVYDASAKCRGPFLNDCLYTGPNFNQQILNILLKFHSYSIALTADIEKAFLIVSVSEEDRDALRFLWVYNVDKLEPEVQIYLSLEDFTFPDFHLRGV